MRDDTNDDTDHIPDDYEVDDDSNPDDVTIHTIEEEDSHTHDYQLVVPIHPVPIRPPPEDRIPIHGEPRSAQPKPREPRCMQQVEVTPDLPVPTEGVRRARKYCPHQAAT